METIKSIGRFIGRMVMYVYRFVKYVAAYRGQ